MILFMIQFFIYVILSLCLVVCAYMFAILLVIDSLRYSWKRFHSSWVSAGHHHVLVIPYFGKRGVTWFCWYQSQVSHMPYIQSGHIYDNRPRNYLSKQSFDPLLGSILVQSITENPWTVTLMWLSHPYSHRTYSSPTWSCLLRLFLV